MSVYPGFGQPGIGTELVTFESEIYWGSDQARASTLWQSAVIDGAARDAGNTPTVNLRPGLLLGKVTATGKYKEWNSGAGDGSEVLVGWLDSELRATDQDGNNTDRNFRVGVARGALRAKKLLIQGAAFVGHADELVARQALQKALCVLDDDPAATQVLFTYAP